jgi:general secretion pathway protein D
MKIYHKIQQGFGAAIASSVLMLAVQAFGGGGQFGGGGGGGQGFQGGFNNANRTTATYGINGTVGTATISVDPQTHSLVVIADAETMMQISNVLRNLDIPKPQVLIKVVFVEVRHDNSREIGLEGGWVDNSGDTRSSAGNVLGLSGLNGVVTNFNSLGQPLSTALAAGSGGTGLGSIYQIVGNDFQATLRAIARAGKVKVLSRPSVLARDGQLARIVVGQQVPLPSGVSFTEAGDTTVPIINVTYTDIGIILNVTPFIGDNGLVEMILQPQISAVSTTQSQPLSVEQGVSAPYVDLRSADTVVVTPTGQTVVIGGLIANDETSGESKVPFLGDIPLLGNLFKMKSKSNTKSELMIFLTPHIVESPRQLAGLSRTEMQRSMMLTNAVSEQQLNQFLDNNPAERRFRPVSPTPGGRR